MFLPTSVLLDTNVWLDAFDGTRARSERANELLAACVRRGVDVLFAAESVKDVHHLVAASLKRRARDEGRAMGEGQARAISAYASACVDTMCEVGTAVGMDASDVWLARKYQRVHRDFEDCLVLAAAQRARAGLLVSSDERLVRHAPVAALSVEDALALLGGDVPDAVR